MLFNIVYSTSCSAYYLGPSHGYFALRMIFNWSNRSPITLPNDSNNTTKMTVKNSENCQTNRSPFFLRILLDDHFQFWLKKPRAARKRASCREVPMLRCDRRPWKCSDLWWDPRIKNRAYLPILWPLRLSVSMFFLKIDNFDYNFLYFWLSLTISIFSFYTFG